MVDAFKPYSLIVIWTSIALMVFSALLIGCDTSSTSLLPQGDEVFGKTIYLNGEKCSYTSDDENVYITCGPLAQIESDTDPLVYYAFIEDIEDVYDGDTIQNVLVLIHKFNRPQTENVSLWPGVVRHTDGIYSLTDIRIRGIDAPEHRVSTEKTEEEKARIKERAAAATVFLKVLIEKSSINGIQQSIEIRDPDFGTYAGRVVADVFCYHDGEEVDVAQALIDAHHAVAYDGGTKTFDWGAEELDFDETVESEE